MIGRVFGRLTIMEYAGVTHSIRRWQCRCDCGRETITREDHLRNGRIQSCGCLRDELARTRITHGDARVGKHTREYRAWAKMLARCNDANDKRYARYGGRGIRVCNRWKEYAAFLSDMGRCPSGLTLERINNDGHYEPGNVRWDTPAQQARNRSSTRWLTHNGITLCMKDWAHRLGFRSYGVIANRLKHGWSVERTLTTPARKVRRRTTPAAAS